MAYQALYRTYRPTKFNDVVGQKHIIQILQNAVFEKKTSHAYVFSGLRGIGKTTIARIFAKAVNCENSYDGEPCDNCDNCRAIIEDATTDVIELDAASNNGVDQMRDILEKVNFLPSTLNKKVYIIDEAHMLSTAAFNALLKTLEEPPAHVIFILATTEPYKIPSTILSRCQRLDFKQLSTNEIVEMLIKVSTKEKIKITDDALVAIAEASEGGMRDALSILDQARVYNFNQITLENINDITGRVSFDYLVDLIRALNLRDPGEALSKVELLIESGKEVSRILNNLIQFCRDLLLYKNLKEEVSAAYIYRKDVFSQVAREITENKLFYYVDMFVDIQNKIRFTNSPKLHLEVGIIKIVNNATSDIDVLTKIQRLEEKIDLVQPSGNSGSLNEVSLRLDSMDNKIRKLTNDLNKINIDEFKDSILIKIGLLEDMVLQNKNIPAQFEEQIQELKNSIHMLESVPTLLPSEVNQSGDIANNELSQKLQELEQKLSSTNNNEFDSSIFDEKIKQLEEKINSVRTNDLSDYNFDELYNKVVELENELDIIKIQKQPSFTPSANSNINVDQIVKEVEEKLSTSNNEELYNKVVELENELDIIKIQGHQPVVSNNNVDIEAIIKEVEEKLSTSNNEELYNKVVELENELDIIKIQRHQPVVSSNNVDIEAIIKEVEEKLSTSNNEELYNKVVELENELDIIKIQGRQPINSSIDEELNKLRDEINIIKNISNKAIVSDNPLLGDSELSNKIVVIEEYLDMVINRVDELARTVKENKPVESTEDVPASNEIAQLNENYLSLINFIQELQQKVDSPSAADPEVIEAVKAELNELLNNTINELQSKIDDNQSEITNKVNSNYQYFQDQIIEIESKLQTPIVDYSSQIDENKQAIQEVKDYSIKLSSKVKEVQDRINEVNTKLDGGYTKRRSPFEIVREEEKPEVKEEVVVEQPKQEKQEVIESTPKAVTKTEKTVVIRSEQPKQEPEKVDESSKIYDAKIVERILHQARDRKCREEKVQILSNWHKMEVKVGHLLAPTAKLLAEGTLTANGFNELLIVFPHASMCNHLMEPKGHTNAIQILKTTFGKDYDFIALPENTWQEKRLEYAGQYNMGIKYPKLTPIKNPELKIVVVNSASLMSKKNQSIHKAQSFFGEDMVEKEEE